MEMETSLMKALENLHLADKAAAQMSQPEADYVLDLAVQDGDKDFEDVLDFLLTWTYMDVLAGCDDPLLAAVCSNFTIQLMSKTRLTHRSTISGHKDTVTKVQFGKTDFNLVYSSSKDKTVRCWDTRVSNSKEVHLFKAPPAVQAEMLSLDISHSDRLLCAATEWAGSESYILFWDTRQQSLLGCYSECHQDDITQVCFQPGSDRYLASGSADGLVCTFDLTETTEDSALQVTCNAESDVARVGWCGNKADCVYCVTSDNDFRVWDALDVLDTVSAKGDSCCTVDCFSGATETASVDYVIDCIPELTASNDRSNAVLLVGTHSGSLQLLLCSDLSKDTQTLASLNGGHTTTVRSSSWDTKTQSLLTGGEDSLVCLWSTNPSAQFSAECNKTESPAKIKGKVSVSEHTKKPYSKK